METTNLLVMCALAAAAAFGVLYLEPPVARLVTGLQKMASLHPEARQKELSRIVLAQGVRAFYPVAAKLLGIPAVHSFISECMNVIRERGHPEARIQAFTSSLVLLFLLLVALASVLLGSFASGIAVSLAVVALVVFVIRNERDKRANRLRLCVPDSIQGMKSCFQAGLSLEQTLEYLANHTNDEMAKVYKKALRSLRLGGSTPEALNILRVEVNAPEFIFVIAALDIQHKTGGSLSSVLQDAEEAARGQFELERSLRTQTAQARLSARVVSAMPVVLVGLFSLITEGFLDPFFSSVAGFLLLLLAICMQVAGVFMVRKTLHVKGVSA